MALISSFLQDYIGGGCVGLLSFFFCFLFEYPGPEEPDWGSLSAIVNQMYS